MEKWFDVPAGGGTTFLTGATGYVGAHLLAACQQWTDREVWCLVRAESPSEAEDRLAETADRYRVPIDPTDQQLRLVTGDVTREKLGLEPDTYATVADAASDIFHTAARVSWLESYGELKPANVEGTKRILRLAGEESATSVHYTSTMVFYGMGYERIAEDCELHRPEAANADSGGTGGWPIDSHGYGRTKWVAEHLLHEARDRGFDVQIYRFSHTAGPRDTGVVRARDLYWQAVRHCIDIGLAPDLDVRFFSAPVDFVSQAILYLGSTASDQWRYHVGNFPSMANSIEQLREYVERYGFDVDLAAFPQWRERALAEVDGPLRAMRPAYEALQTLEGPELEARTDITFDFSATLDALDLDRSEIPSVGYDWYCSYFDYLRDLEVLPDPG